ncbi:MAG: rubrerythrin family protein [Methylophagaceae bacterium]
MSNQQDVSKTIQNLEAAFAGESMANRKYLYFAKQCRALGDDITAAIFEKTAAQETAHAFGHLELLFPSNTLTVEKMLQLAIDGETYEYTKMYPEFRNTAIAEKNAAAVAEMDEQIEESKEHAAMFAKILATAEKRFAALAKVEKRHAQHYQDALSASKITITE